MVANGAGSIHNKTAVGFAITPTVNGEGFSDRSHLTQTTIPLGHFVQVSRVFVNDIRYIRRVAIWFKGMRFVCCAKAIVSSTGENDVTLGRNASVTGVKCAGNIFHSWNVSGIECAIVRLV
jgi:hypothetical protein